MILRRSKEKNLQEK